MIRLDTNTPALFNELCEVIRLFYGQVPISAEAGDEVIAHRHADDGGEWIESFDYNGQTVVHRAQAFYGGLEEKRRLKRAVKTGCFLLMREVTGVSPPWGSLTGIRPTRIMYELRERGLTDQDAVRAMEDTYYVSREKAELLRDILDMQSGLVDTPRDMFDLYVGIPFCTTRCAYCSFSSGTLGDGRRVEPYLAALKGEMALDRELMLETGHRIRAFYMGGGTPTSLTAGQMDDLLREVNRLFPGAREMTVEAGRPDTITSDKLMALRDNGVKRISVNPQTFSDETLRRIGRAHTSRDTLEAYDLARRMGFDDINMDLIAVLPGEGRDAFAASLRQAISLSPDSITVHTLAIKRSSKLHEMGYTQAPADVAADMVHMARQALDEAGYRPYYLYRQKYMAGNLENVGYAKEGKACLYNIDNMEETTKILAEGAGAITKWLFPRERRIERSPNVKNIDEYIARAPEMAARKRTLILSTPGVSGVKAPDFQSAAAACTP